MTFHKEENQSSKERELAIVIPAYKSEFLDQTLSSIALQTNKNFTVYIGNDNSPDDLFFLCKKYQNEFDLHYKKFGENLGGKSLIMHWQRCIDLSTEKWIWLFSDDDLMDKNAVEVFYEQIKRTKEKHDIYRFEVATIDDKNNTIKNNQNYPQIESAESYIRSKFLFKNQSCITNSIFKREKYLKVGKFENFDLAWGADDTLWVKVAHPHGIYTTANAKVYFRIGSKNISNNNSRKILYRKIDAQYEFISWVGNFIKKHNLKLDEFIEVSQNWFYNVTFGYQKILYPLRCLKMAKTGSEIWKNSMFIHILKIVLFTKRLIIKKIKCSVIKK